MKVLKFGGSSLADAPRYMRVMEISTATHQTDGAAVVLSAPKGVTNALSLLCEQAAAGEDFQPLFNKLNDTVTGIANNGLFGYFKSLVPSGMPVWLLPIMIPIEILTLFAKPFALCIRLFANMIAGHVAILVFLGLIIMLQSYLVDPFSVVLAAAIYMLEIFIAFIQAFIFTLLSALFISMAAHPEH